MAFQIVRLELDRAGHIVDRRPLQPIFELREDAMALAQFDAGRCNGEFGYDAGRDCGGQKTRAAAIGSASSLCA